MDPEAIGSTFLERGVVRLDGAIAAADAGRMREAIWAYAARKADVSPTDPSTWPEQRWLPISWKGLRRNPVFRPVLGSPAVRGALDAVFAPAGWDRPKPGAQVLFSLPASGSWSFPAGWHIDGGFETATWPVPAVKLFAFCDEVAPCGGGTMVLAGTHRLVARYRSTFDRPPPGGKEHWQRFLRRHPPLGDLLRADAQPDHGRSLVGERLVVDGVPVEVVELTGKPGDVVLTHLHVFHTVSPNTSTRPRMMLGKAVLAATA